MKFTVSHTIHKKYHQYLIVGNDGYVGYEPIGNDSFTGFPDRARLVYKTDGGEKILVYSTSATFCQNFFGLPQTIYKNGEKVGSADLKSREFFIQINDVVYEISYHKKKMFSIMRNDVRFAVGQYFADKPYEIFYDGKIENDTATILFLAMYVERIFRIVTRSQVDSLGGPELWFDYKEKRTMWRPPSLGDEG